MLPVYISYFAGGEKDRDTKKTLLYAFGFFLGFSIIFVVLGALSGLVGELLHQYDTVINIVAGAVVVLFGLSYIGVFNIHFLHRTRVGGVGKVSGFFSAFVFGIVFSISWTPCVGMFLGSALMLASQQGSMIRGVFMLISFSVGLGLPFFISALLIDRLKSTLDWIKKRHNTVNLISGLFLVAMGILMMTGMLHSFFDMLLH